MVVKHPWNALRRLARTKRVFGKHIAPEFRNIKVKKGWYLLDQDQGWWFKNYFNYSLIYPNPYLGYDMSQHNPFPI